MFNSSRPTPVLESIPPRVQLLRGVILVSVLFVLFSVDFSNLSLTVGSLSTAVLHAMAAILVSGGVAVLLLQTSAPRWRLVGAVLAIVYGTMYLLPATETAYLGGHLPPSEAIYMVLSGLLVASIFALLSVALFAPATNSPTEGWKLRLAMPGREWAWKLLSLAGVWTALFILFGFLVYQPIAGVLDPAGLKAEQAAVTNAGIALLSQPVWGIVLVALSVPLVRSLNMDWKRTALALGAVLAVLGGADILLATGMSSGLQIGHLAEVAGESFVFGVCSVWVLNLGGRLPSATWRSEAKARLAPRHPAPRA